MSAIEVTTQAQLDKALKNLKDGDWIVCLGGDVWNPLRIDGNASVRAYGNASVRADGNASVEADGNASVEADGNASVRADGNASVRAYGNASVRADGNASVGADGNASVRAYGNASVRADGNASVEAYGNASVRAYGNASVRAYGNASVGADGNASVEAGPVVPVQKYPRFRGKISGGVVIDVPDLTALSAAEWLAHYGVKVTRGRALLFKAVDDDFSTERARHAGITYEPGSAVEASDWSPEPHCGFGLHMCAKPWISARYNATASRYVQVLVKVADLVVIADGDGDKVKAPRVEVGCECDIDGVPVEAEAAA